MIKSAQSWIKVLFPNELVTCRLSDLYSFKERSNENEKGIYISVEKNNKSREFCFLTLDQLNILFDYCPVNERTLYESIPGNIHLKLYLDYEYYIANNLEIQDHDIGLRSCLRIFDFLLNSQHDNQTEIENKNNEKFLNYFLVLDA